MTTGRAGELGRGSQAGQRREKRRYACWYGRWVWRDAKQARREERGVSMGGGGGRVLLEGEGPSLTTS